MSWESWEQRKGHCLSVITRIAAAHFMCEMTIVYVFRGQAVIQYSLAYIYIYKRLSNKVREVQFNILQEPLTGTVSVYNYLPPLSGELSSLMCVYDSVILYG